MKTILAFGASNSRKSINQQLANWAANQLEEAKVKLLDLNDFELPIYSTDRQEESGIPEKAKYFKELVNQADGIVISFAEHNGSFSAAFKNIFDWMSRIGRPIWSEKPMFLMGTSPGGRGAKGVLAHAENTFPHQGAKVVATFSLPSFNQNFDQEEGIINEELKAEFQTQLVKFSNSMLVEQEV